MNAALIALFSLICFFLGYRFYAKFLGKRIFRIDLDSRTPAHEFRDGVDYVPTNKYVLFGHHFTSIAGAAPIVGPAIAVIWGWLPAVLWVMLGTIFIGAVHDFGCLVISAKNRGHSVGDLAGNVIGKRVRVLFLTIIFFLTWVVIAVFAYIISSLFVQFPTTVLPVNIQIVIAVTIGIIIYRTKFGILIPSIIALLVLYAFIYFGTFVPIHLPVFVGGQTESWVLLLLIYAFVASVLPVWLLLQPRDFINSHQLFVGLGAMYLGLFIVHPQMVAPALNLEIEGGVPWFPFLFITIACGAVSGFHGLVGSGTTSKQINAISDSKMIGYGSMLGEGSLGLMSVLASTAGFATAAAWQSHYSSWGAAGSMDAKIGAFVNGGAYFLKNGLMLPDGFGTTMIAVIVISFAATTLDTSTRIQRYITSELGEIYNIKILTNRFVAAAIAAFTPLILIFGGEGLSWKRLWPIFGAANQLLAGLSLLILSVYLFRKGRKVLFTLIPMIFLVIMTSIAMIMSLGDFIKSRNWVLIILSILLLSFSLWIILEAVVAIRNLRSKGEQMDELV
ncbi:MAG: carbon starvation protein A [Candidatus Scalindua sp. AMX11]|nr:MAG: carbon starvation protein A [Candidatus Scalindua sp.]NOG83192.1 carbon starvation protein A [Planctomycetota bacterium]RZV77557.1 MAG: carbon starvation protein A [Candidatus Scalindua sp. SCAELEC01]TDE64563.1 MAG: carbon starvation protein A [Candidatus Scalindua sp. AMX11]GJQ58623.1 MAG: carbon starvation protein A [Candidatus Scalindua sp.]